MSTQALLWRAWIASLALVGAERAADALVVQGGSMPRPDHAFIGEWNGSSAVAIGPRTIITAAHVGGGAGFSFLMDGHAYQATGAITHPAADLMLVQLGEDLPGWHEIASGAARGSEVVIGGMGRIAGDAAAGGIAWSSTRAESWGRNVIDRSAGGLLSFDFDAGRAAVDHEAALALNDSGGGIFVTGPGGALELAGLGVSIDGPLGATLYGERSFALDLSGYAGFIGGYVPAPGAAGVLAFGLASIAHRRRRRDS